MAEIRINDFAAGWCPCDDPIQGRRNGLLQMDNVELSSNGALTLSGGTLVKWTGFPADAHTLFSRLINGARHDYSALADGSIYRDATVLAASGGDTTNAAFGTAFNFTLIASGNKRLKDAGTGSPINLGILPPTVAPTVSQSVSNSPYSNIGSVVANYVVPTGLGSAAVIGGTYLQLTANSSGIFAVQTYNDTSAPYNLNQLQGVGGTANVGYATDEDYIQVSGYTPIVVGRTLTLDILLSAGGSTGAVESDYYSYTIDDLSTVSYSSYGTFTFKVRRNQFTRIGSGSQDWSKVYGFRISYAGGAASEVVNLLGFASGSPEFTMLGGSNSQSGQYQYLQVNVNNTGSYLAKSTIGPLTAPYNTDMGQFLITPQDPASVDTQCNEAWIFRRGGNLDAWYRVMVFTAGTFATPKYDILSDQNALTLNITINLNLVSVASSVLTDKIYDIIGPVNGRWYYFTTNFMYPSDINNPDLIDASLAVRTCGSSSELFLWARLVATSTVLVGTSVDVYNLSGTFATLPDNTIDVYYLPTGCHYPPITCDAEVWGGSVYYMASDGWRIINGSGQAAFVGNTNVSLVSPTLDRLYRGETVQGYSPPGLTVIPRSVRFPIVIAKNKMWCFITGIATPRIEVYDFIRQYWRVSTYGLGDVTAATRTQDGRLIAFYATDNKIREIDYQASNLIDGTTKQTVVIKTMVFDGGLPRQRKDSSTLKIRLANSDSFNVSVAPESTTIYSAGSIATQATLADAFIDLFNSGGNLSLVKTYQVILGTSTPVSALTIDDISILFTTRPEQVTFLRVQSNNFGTTARKRISTIPYVIDSLGNSVTLTPYLDGSAAATNTVSSSRKTSFNYEFTSGTPWVPLVIDYEFTLSSSGLFEFFGFGEPRIVEVYPQQCRAFVIPVSNFGSSVKKRIRVWPMVLSAPSAVTVTFTPIIDGADGVSVNFNVTTEKQDFRYFFKTDIFGVDYSGKFSASTEFEQPEMLAPEIVQSLPIAKQFDQVGPQELFRFGKVVQIELRVLPFGTSIPWNIFFQDGSNQTGSFTVINGVDASYFIKQVKGTSGNILRIELGPTSFDFHRFYMRALVLESGKDTEGKWVEL